MIIIGLGNPEKKYENTYHNVGFSVLDKLSEKIDTSVKYKECKSLTSVVYVNGKKIILAKPMTYMNLSGEAVRELIGKYSTDSDDVMIIYDDVDLNIGDVRMRKKGSGGTHNGMRNIVSLCSENLPRLRIGIGKPTPPMQLVDYVLSKISGDNKIILNNTINFAACAILNYLTHCDLDKLTADLANYKCNNNE